MRDHLIVRWRRVSVDRPQAYSDVRPAARQTLMTERRLPSAAAVLLLIAACVSTHAAPEAATRVTQSATPRDRRPIHAYLAVPAPGTELAEFSYSRLGGGEPVS